MNMIGKISGLDWSKAPEDATHIASRWDGSYDSWCCFYKKEDGIWYFDISDRGNWEISGNAKYPWFKPISKEEDLGINKQVKSIEDLTVGMFVKNAKGYIYVYNGVTLCLMNPSSWQCNAWDNSNMSNFVGLEYKFDKDQSIVSWSYTYDGEYNPIVKETEQEIKLKELESEAKKLLEAAEKVNQQIKELKRGVIL